MTPIPTSLGLPGRAASPSRAPEVPKPSSQAGQLLGSYSSLLALLFLGWFALLALQGRRPPASEPGRQRTAHPGLPPVELEPLPELPGRQRRASCSAAPATPLLVSKARQAAPESGQVRGSIRVLDAISGRPAPGSQVEFAFYPQASEEEFIELRSVDAEGRVECEFGAGELRLLAWGDSQVAGPTFLDLVPGEPFEATLRLQASGRLQGRILDAHSGQPLEGARVRFRTFSERDEVRTDAQGWFEHPRFPPSGMAEQLHVECEGYGSAIRYLSMAADGSWELPAERAGSPSLRGEAHAWVELGLLPELRISGQVQDPSGAPVAAAEVHCEGFFRALPDVAVQDTQQQRSDSQGRFDLRGLRADISHGLVVSAPGFEEYFLELGKRDEPHVELPAIVLIPESLVAGMIVDANGAPVEDLQVELIRWEQPGEAGHAAGGPAASRDVSLRLHGLQREVRSDSLGTFLFERTRPAAYRLFVERDDQTLLSVELSVEAVRAGQALRLQLPARFSTLVGRLPGAPQGTRVELHRAGPIASVGTDAQGFFRFAGLDLEDSYGLRARGLLEDESGALLPWNAQLECWAHESPMLQMAPTQLSSEPMLAESGMK